MDYRVIRVEDPCLIEEAIGLYPFEDIILDAKAWIDTPENFALTDDRGNIGMFETFTPGVYTGHYFFKDKGKAAKELAIKMLAEAFETAEIVRGLTPVKHKAALYMTRMLGFKSYGEVDTWIGPCVIFMMTKAEFKEKYR